MSIHTYANHLQIPNYTNKKILYERLTLDVREGKNSFGFVYFGTNKVLRKTVDIRQKMRHRKIEKNIFIS